MNSEWQSLPPQTQQELKNTMNAMQPPQSVEEVKATLETTEKGGVRQSIRNCLTVFQRDPVLAGAIAYNILTDRKDIIKPIGFHRESTALTDTDMKYLLLYLEETYGLTSEKKIETAIGIVANENKYHHPGFSEQPCMGRDGAHPLLSAALSGGGCGRLHL